MRMDCYIRCVSMLTFNAKIDGKQYREPTNQSTTHHFGKQNNCATKLEGRLWITLHGVLQSPKYVFESL